MMANFENRIIVYSIVLGVIFFVALYLAYRNRPGKNNDITDGNH